MFWAESYIIWASMGVYWAKVAKRRGTQRLRHLSSMSAGLGDAEKASEGDYQEPAAREGVSR